MITEAKIEEIVKELTEDKDIFFVDLSIGSGNIIRVLLDKPEGITINECAQMSRMIEEKLNRDEEDYELQVSSPGLNMPFRVLEQYHKNTGKNIEVITKDGLKNKGILKRIDNKGIEITVKPVSKKGKKNKVIDKDIYFAFNQIKSAKRIIDSF